MMVDEDKLIRMFEEVNGKYPIGSFSIEVTYDHNGNPDGIKVLKHSITNSWHSLSDILFNYITKDWS